MRFTTKRAGGHNVTIPDHSALRTGTLGALLREIEQHHGLTREELFELLFGG